MRKYHNEHTKLHENDVVTFGFTEPILTILDVGGFSIENLFLISLEPEVGTILFDTRDRAERAARILEPGYEAKVERFDHTTDWSVEYVKRDFEGVHEFVTEHPGMRGA